MRLCSRSCGDDGLVLVAKVVVVDVVACDLCEVVSAVVVDVGAGVLENRFRRAEVVV